MEVEYFLLTFPTYITDGSIECCYRIDDVYEDYPLVSGSSAWNKGAGFYRENEGKEEEENAQKICCEDAERNFYCHLFDRKRPFTNDKQYEERKIGKFSWNIYAIFRFYICYNIFFSMNPMNRLLF